MTDVIVAFAKEEDGKSIRNILMRSGIEVSAVCTSAAQVLTEIDERAGGVIICGYRLRDMIFSELNANLPPCFSMLLLASPARMQGSDVQNVVYVPMPLKVYDLVQTVNMMCEQQLRRRRKKRGLRRERTEEEQRLIEQAKHLLMERNGMSEEEAHRYLQKRSMENATNLVETAQMLLSLIHA